jgi:hypothetical protein
MNAKTTMLAGAISAVAAMTGCGGEAQAAITFVNGGFEAGTSAGWDLMDNTNTPGWTIIYGTSGSFPRLNLNQANGGPYGNNNDGKQFATIGGIEDGGTSALEQAVSGFTPGKTYTLTWLQSSEFTASDTLQVSFVSGSSTPSQIFSSVPYPGGGLYWDTWQTETMKFVADAATVDFHFQSAFDPNNPTYEVGVDNFQISSGVPESSTWALMLLGFAGLGFVGYRKTKGRPGLAA